MKLKVMKNILRKMPRLFLGFALASVGIVMTINAHLGLAPWDVLHQGVAELMGISIGRANIVLGFIIVVLNSTFGESIGLGTILNMMFIGLFIDFLMFNEIIPIFTSFVPSFIMMLLGLLVMGYGSAVYMRTGLGTGPRDGLMVAITKRTGKSVRLVKTSVEILAIIAGYLLGGSVGIGTAFMAITGGYFFQFAFKTANFDVTDVEHRSIIDEIKDLKARI